MSKVIHLHIGGTTRLFSVHKEWGHKEVKAAFQAAVETAIKDGHRCLASAIPNETLIAFGLKPYGIAEVFVDNVDLALKSLDGLGVSISNCAACDSFDSGVCLHFGGEVEDWNEYHDCCRADNKHYLYYTSERDGGELITDFVLLDEALFPAIPKLIEVLAPCISAVSEMCNADGFDVNRVSIEPA